MIMPNHKTNARKQLLSAAAGASLLLGVVAPASAALLFDRGLPGTNLNAPAGADRSNVTWQSSNTGGNFVGDDFSIGVAGESYVIDSLTVWGAQFDPLSADIGSITLWLGQQGTQLNAVSTGTVTGNDNSNPNITHSFVTYADGVTDTYFATNANDPFPVAQTVFSGLNFTVDGGVLYDFGIAATGNFGWFGHASNAALGGVTADGADGFVRIFNNTGSLVASVQSGPGTGAPNELIWDKSSDMNVQIAGRLQGEVPAPSVLALLASGLLGAGLLRRRRAA
jgi:hypothetical protein